MNFSAPQWLASFVIDLLIKTSLIAVLDLLSLIGAPRSLLAEVGSSALMALALSSLHFGCLALGNLAAAALERAVRLVPMLQFWFAVLVANVFFAAAIGTYLVLSAAQGARPSISLLLWVIEIFVVVNLLPVVAVYLCGRMFRFIKPS